MASDPYRDGWLEMLALLRSTEDAWNAFEDDGSDAPMTLGDLRQRTLGALALLDLAIERSRELPDTHNLYPLIAKLERETQAWVNGDRQPGPVRKEVAR